MIAFGVEQFKNCYFGFRCVQSPGGFALLHATDMPGLDCLSVVTDQRDVAEITSGDGGRQGDTAGTRNLGFLAQFAVDCLSQQLYSDAGLRGNGQKITIEGFI